PPSPFLPLFADNFARYRGVEQEALMGTATHADTAIGADQQDFVDHIITPALEVAIDHHRMGSNALADHNRCVQFPFLFSVEIAAKIRETPPPIHIRL